MTRRIRKTARATAAVLLVGSIVTVCIAATVGLLVWSAGVDETAEHRQP